VRVLKKCSFFLIVIVRLFFVCQILCVHILFYSFNINSVVIIMVIRINEIDKDAYYLLHYNRYTIYYTKIRPNLLSGRPDYGKQNMKSVGIGTHAVRYTP